MNNSQSFERQQALRRPVASPRPASKPVFKERPEQQPEPQVPKKLPEPDITLWQAARRMGRKVRFALVDGSEIIGLVHEYGMYSVTIRRDGKSITVFKHSMITAEITEEVVIEREAGIA